MGYNISEVSGGSVGAGPGGFGGWTFTVDLSDPSVTVVTGDFDQVSLGGVNQGEAPDGYVFSSLSTTAYGTLTYNTTDGTFTFTIDRDAVFASGSDQTVSFTVTGSDGGNSDEDTVFIDLVICVTRGTRIRTNIGRLSVEVLQAGDLVWTLDNGYQEVRWIGSRKIDTNTLLNDPSLRPIHIAPGALGDGRPRRRLSVSPQHRVLLRDWRAQLFFGLEEVLVAAKALVNDTTIRVDNSANEVEYFHLLFDSHEVIETDGALTESFHPGPYTMREIDDDARQELFDIFPALAADLDSYGPAARASLKAAEARIAASLDPFAAAFA